MDRHVATKDKAMDEPPGSPEFPGGSQTASGPESARFALGATPWLQAVPAATLDRLAGQAVLHRVPSGSLLFEQAETPAFAQFLVGGSVELLGIRGSDETLVEVVRPVDLLLPAAVLNRQPYLLRAKVLEEAYLVMIQADLFRREIVTDHALCLAVLACEAAHFRRQIKHAKNVKLRSAEERAGFYLLELAGDAPAGRPVKLPLEKRLIASQLGMTRETLSRTFAALARHGIRVTGDTVAIENLEAARARFPFDPLIDGPEPIIPLQNGNL
ncbi:MAG: helix-turn-helix domain-containing protein [Beijerinckiaceae bacterium]|jgi:CRP/FNR family transcriptional activator FtrB